MNREYQGKYIAEREKRCQVTKEELEVRSLRVEQITKKESVRLIAE